MGDSVGELTVAERRRVLELLEALRTDVVSDVNPASEIVTPEFAEEFQSRLLSQHVFLGNPLFQESFDAAFVASAEVAGHRVAEAPSGQRFWDVTVNGRPISLKSTKARSLRADKLHVSKLTEAAWIQDCRTARTRRKRTRALFTEYSSEVSGILQMRYFSRTETYELVEVPVELFAPIEGLPVDAFSADGPSINIPIGQNPPDFTLKLDRSDSKITIANIAKSKCILHASWTIA